MLFTNKQVTVEATKQLKVKLIKLNMTCIKRIKSPRRKARNFFFFIAIFRLVVYSFVVLRIMALITETSTKIPLNIVNI